LEAKGFVDCGVEEREGLAWVEYAGCEKRDNFGAECGLRNRVRGKVVGDCCEEGGVVDARRIKLGASQS
jgi:hypothetical protein